VTNAVNRLEEQGLLTREPHPSDGRTTLATITPLGRSLAEKATDAVNRDVFTQPGLEPDAINALVEVIRALRYQAGDWEEPEPA
jgi:DNA-binding MarR family transcriptional regulator